MSDFSQPGGTPTAIYRVVSTHRWVDSTGTERESRYQRFYWTLAGAERFADGRKGGGSRESHDWMTTIEEAPIGEFRQVAP